MTRTAGWYFTASRDPAESVVAALDSGIVDRVFVAVGNRDTSDRLHHPETTTVISECQRRGVPIVLVRYWWPSREPAPLSMLCDGEHYMRELVLGRAEAQTYNAAFGIDMEPYGATPLHDHVVEHPQYLGTVTLDSIRGLVRAVREYRMQADYILPAGSVRPSHPYNLLAAMGLHPISEHTYYDRPCSPQYHYDVAGLCVSTAPGNAEHPEAKVPFYTVANLLPRLNTLYPGKELLIYPHEGEALAVAQQLRRNLGETGHVLLPG